MDLIYSVVNLMKNRKENKLFGSFIFDKKNPKRFRKMKELWKTLPQRIFAEHPMEHTCDNVDSPIPHGNIIVITSFPVI